MKRNAQETTDRPVAAEYVLGLLPPQEADAFEAAMKDDPMLRASYVQWAAHFSNQNGETAPVAPPEHVFQNIDKAIFLNDVKEVSGFARYGGMPLVGAAALCIIAVMVWVAA